jgi:hypothetical protein
MSSERDMRTEHLINGRGERGVNVDAGRRRIAVCRSRAKIAPPPLPLRIRSCSQPTRQCHAPLATAHSRLRA